jgi:putative membrane protein
MRFLQSWFLIALGVLVAAHVNDGISYDGGWTLFWVVTIMSVLNTIVKPLLVLFTLPFILLTLGMGIWLINALLLVWTAKLVSGFHVDSFGSALWGALIVSFISVLVNTLLTPMKSPKLDS